MSTQPREGDSILLDRYGDSAIPPDYLLVQSPREFVANATRRSKLVIRGERLCHWAQEFYAGRSIATTVVDSPVRELQKAFFGLNDVEAVALRNTYGQGWQTPLSVPDVLQSVWPDFRWAEIPSKRHAARWLTWLADLPEDSLHLSLIQRAAADFRANGSSEYSDLYVADQARSRLILQGWMGIAKESKYADLGPFPEKVSSSWKDVARDIWSAELVTNGVKIFTDARRCNVPYSLLQLLADMCCDYVVEHRQIDDARIITALAQYVSDKKANSLRKLIPPAIPIAPPSNAESVHQWFISSYLPYRLWQVEHGDAAAQKYVTDLARQFGQWYLTGYPPALSGSGFFEQLAIRAASKIKTQHRSDGVLFWIILDGMNMADAALFVQFLLQEPRLSETTTTYAFATLPTITEFCKPSLLAGLPPKIAKFTGTPELFPDAIRLEANKDAVKKTSDAKIGTVFVWKIDEPDKSYHRPFDRSTIRHNVEGELKTFADRVIEAVLAVHDDYRTEIVICTDHGRLIGPSRRTVPVPNTMEAHGRAAWGSAPEIPSGTSYVVQGNVAFLSSTQYQLPSDCAIVLDEDMFEKVDGASGSEVSSHGGVYPEEIITPWVELARDARLPQIIANVTGSGRAGRAGSVHIAVMNPAPISVTILALHITLPSRSMTIELNETVSPMSQIASDSLSGEIARWPTALEAADATAVVDIKLQNGIIFTKDVDILLSSEELYKQDFSLKDLI